jgi:predicted TIM-barrel fold metal-dependent hydrolase
MDEDHVLAALLFPTLPGFDGNRFSQHPDKDLALLCLQAYNDWMLDELCMSNTGRFIGLALVPMWDADLAAAEAKRAIEKGARAISFSMAPHNLGFPSIWDPNHYWDRLFAVMSEAGLPLCTHLGTNTNGTITNAIAEMGRHGPPRVGAVMMQLDGQRTLLEWINSGNLERFPQLRVALSENGIGWIPTVLQVADWMTEMSRSRVTVPADFENDPMLDETAREIARLSLQAKSEAAANAPLPSELFRQHVYGCFINDPVGLRVLDLIGEDNVMIETDFPHNSTWYPNSMPVAQQSLAHLPADIRRKILRGNAERIFQFTPAEPTSKKCQTSTAGSRDGRVL